MRRVSVLKRTVSLKLFYKPTETNTNINKIFCGTWELNSKVHLEEKNLIIVKNLEKKKSNKG